jgi:hypothetical protein
MFGGSDSDSDNDSGDLMIPQPPERVEVLPTYGQTGGLSHETIQHIIRQKEEYFAYRRERDERIWNDPDFHPGPLLDKIAEKITLGLIREATNLLESTCDDFIDCLVRSEFFPDE